MFSSLKSVIIFLIAFAFLAIVVGFVKSGIEQRKINKVAKKEAEAKQEEERKEEERKAEEKRKQKKKQQSPEEAKPKVKRLGEKK